MSRAEQAGHEDRVAEAEGETVRLVSARPEGGDAACWLTRVCAACGAIQDVVSFDRCARCDAAAQDR